MLKPTVNRNPEKQPEKKGKSHRGIKKKKNDRFLVRNNVDEKTVEQHHESTEISQPRIIYPTQISFKTDKIKIILDIETLKDFITNRPAL